MAQRPIFEIQGAVGGEPVQIPFGPWLLWGQPQVAYINVRPQPANRGDVYYHGWVRLARSPFGSSSRVDISDPEHLSHGSTGIVLPEGYDVALGFEGNAPALELKTDDAQHLSQLYFPRINAPSIEIALEGVERIVSTVIWTLTATTNLPLFYDAIIVKSMDGAQYRANTRGRAPDVGITELDSACSQPSLRPFVSQYVEGVRSSSDLYAFLCYFKICERINVVRGRLRKLCDRSGIPPPDLNGTFPEDPIAWVSSEMIGVKYTVAISRYQALYRDAIAHFNPADRLEPLIHLQNEAGVRTASILLRWAAFDLINQVATAMHALVAAGMEMGAIEFG